MSCDFRAPGWFGRHPIVGVLMFVLGGLVFAVLGYELRTHGPLMQWDVPLASSYHIAAQRATPGFQEVMTFGFFLGKEIIEIIGALLIVYFVYNHFWPEFGMVALGWSGGAGLWILITQYFHRARPDAQMGIVVHEPSFPSGHVMQSVMCFGLLAYFIIPKMPTLFWKWTVAITAVLTVLFIAYTRLFEGGHYLTDLIAGFALGIAWGGLIYTLMELFIVRRRST